MTEHDKSTLEKFKEWHLEMFFVPAEECLTSHMDRWKGFLGGYNLAKTEGK